MNRTISFSVADDYYAKGEELAHNLCMTSNGCSRLASLAFAQVLSAPEIARISIVPPIIVHPTSFEQRRFYEVYAEVKGHGTLESFALNAMERIWTKDRTTEEQGRKMARLLGYFPNTPPR